MVPDAMLRSGESARHGKLRDECLNEQWFETLHQARSTIAAWRRDYNEVRPHSSLGRIPPARFAEQHRRRTGDAAQTANDKTGPSTNVATRTSDNRLVRPWGAGQF